MAIRCLFLIPSEGCSCQVLKALGAVPMARTVDRLRERYCTSGAFIGCPVFRRVEEGLLEANQLRAPAEPDRAAACA
jgi:hypothetical protein